MRHNERCRQAARKYAAECDVTRFFGLRSRQIEQRLVTLGLGFDRDNMAHVVKTIEARLERGL